MAIHKMQFVEVENEYAMFKCSECGRRIGFATKPEQPGAKGVLKNGDWTMPEGGAEIVAITLGEKCDA